MTTPLSPDELLQWQIDHYAERLLQERKKDNTKAVAWLREQLYKLKTKNPNQ